MGAHTRLDAIKGVIVRHFLLVAICSSLPLASWAAKLETAYNIGNAAAESKTTIKGDLSKEKFLRGFLFSQVRKALENTAYISSIQETEGRESKDEPSWVDYVVFKKNQHIFVNLNLPTKVAMMFAVEQAYRECKPAAKGSESTECSLSSAVTIKGPMTVYGNYASNVKVERLMQDKQELIIELTRSFDKQDLIFSSKFNINSSLFEENLYKFMEFFGVAPEDKSPVALTRQRLLLGVARYMRQVNERILE